MKRKRIWNRALCLLLSTVLFLSCFTFNRLEVHAGSTGSSRDGQWHHYGDDGSRNGGYDSLNYWHDSGCSETSNHNANMSSTRIYAKGRISFSWLTNGCNGTTASISIKISGPGIDGTRTYGGYSGPDHNKHGRWKPETLNLPSDGGGYYTISISSSIGPTHDNGENVGAWVKGLKFEQPYTINYVDVDMYGYETPSEAVNHGQKLGSKTVSGDKLAYQDSFVAYGSDINTGTGDQSEVGRYYTGYRYTGCTSAVVTRLSNVTVYRLFMPIEYTVNLHENRPEDATAEVETTSTMTTHGYTELEEKDDFDSGIWTKKYYYKHVAVEAPSEMMKLLGWHLTNTQTWYRDKDLSKPIRKNNTTLTTVEYDTVDLYPNWEKNKYKIIYNKNDTVYNIYGDVSTTHPTGETPNTDCLYDTDVTLAICQSKKKGYLFKEWNTKSDGSGTGYKEGEYLKKPNFTPVNNGSITLYAIWEPIRYQIRFNSNDDTLGDWNDIDSYFQTAENRGEIVETIRYDQFFTLLKNTFTRTSPVTLSNNETIKKDYSFIGWGNTKVQYNYDFKDEQANLRNFRGVTEDGTVFDLYALWKRPIYLTFNMNGGKYLGSTKDRVLGSTIYNDKYSFIFNIVDGLTSPISGRQLQQDKKIDAYGSYSTASNGVNSKYIKYCDGLEYRFIGWSLDPNAKEPDLRFCPFNSERLNNYEIYNDTTLYAVWEPVLKISLKTDRELGTLNFKYETTDASGNKVVTESEPKVKVDNVTAVTKSPYNETIIRAGEQGYYEITTRNRDVQFYNVFDQLITDNYDHDGVWKDALNPATPENLVSGQTHGLNRKFVINKDWTKKKFYMPQYLGTIQSYEYHTTGGQTEVYNVDFTFSQKSFYYKYVFNTDEIIRITSNIYIGDDLDTPYNPVPPTPDPPEQPDPPVPPQPDVKDPLPSTLDDIKSRIKIRIR